jgi:hypothetical protein
VSNKLKSPAELLSIKNTTILCLFVILLWLGYRYFEIKNELNSTWFNVVSIRCSDGISGVALSPMISHQSPKHRNNSIACITQTKAIDGGYVYKIVSSQPVVFKVSSNGYEVKYVSVNGTSSEEIVVPLNKK